VWWDADSIAGIVRRGASGPVARPRGHFALAVSGVVVYIAHHVGLGDRDRRTGWIDATVDQKGPDRTPALRSRKNVDPCKFRRIDADPGPLMPLLCAACRFALIAKDTGLSSVRIRENVSIAASESRFAV